jgi:hypothetical protein
LLAQQVCKALRVIPAQLAIQVLLALLASLVQPAQLDRRALKALHRL